MYRVRVSAVIEVVFLLMAEAKVRFLQRNPSRTKAGRKDQPDSAANTTDLSPRPWVSSLLETYLRMSLFSTLFLMRGYRMPSL